MNRQAFIVVGLAAVLGAAAYVSGVFRTDEAAPVGAPAATAPPPAPAQPRDTSAPVPTPAPAAANRASRPADPAPRTTDRGPRPADTAPRTEPTTATLRIDSDVPGAQVFVDNKFVGTVPATATDVQPGSRKINVQAPGYDGVVEYVDVTPGPRELTISLKAIRLDQKVSVTHKHRLGSCSGTLIATPDGLRYDTPHAEDRFMVTLADIETFDVNFLEKNLKVKVRRGRSYDFTDPSGKADALYLFHQEVDKVRKRLAGGVK